MESKNMLIQPVEFFTLLSDMTRLRCLALILKARELCVCELTFTLKISQPKVSRHLALLRKFKLVLDRREGLWIYYRLNPDLPPWILQIIEVSIAAIQPIKPFQNDLEQLKMIPTRPALCQSQ